jgi:glycosyltransferase involved in cell wall biosynthesis
MLNLAEAFLVEGRAVDLLLLDEAMGRPLPPGLNAVRLGARTRTALPGLLRYLRAARPDLIISARNHVNLLMLAGRRLAGLSGSSRLVWTYHTHGSAQLAAAQGRAYRVADWANRALARQADACVAVSQGVARDLEERLHWPAGSVPVIDNPVWTASRRAGAQQACPHPWLAARRPGQRSEAAPVVLGAGRLTPQKDFPTLLDAFARLRGERPGARLILLGEGESREAIEAQVGRLGLREAVDLPGHVPDLLPYLARADLFALSSRWEGFALVLVEALGVGCPVVSTDCPSGPREVLQDGRLGPLVPPGDAAALARAMAEVLRDPGDPAPRLEAAARYGADRAARLYREVAAPRD